MKLDFTMELARRVQPDTRTHMTNAERDADDAQQVAARKLWERMEREAAKLARAAREA